MSNRNLYALLVGIDKYQPPVPALDGCVNDMRAVRDYLERYAYRNGFQMQMQILENDQATRFNIVEKFETHLTRARAQDVAFFYYSGHGSQEHSHEIFWKIEEDRKNETLVCYDSRLPDGMDLADKEIATLLDLVARQNPHILTVIDACNSGSGTRGIAKVRNFNSLAPQKREPQSYILPRKMQTDRAVYISADPTELVIPNPRHVALSAAHSFQLAKETTLGGSPRGVFTYSLLEVLENAVGPITYNDLMRQVRRLVQQRTYDQIPQLSTTTSEDLNKQFLNGLTMASTHYYSLTYSQANNWTIDAGAIHGILPPNFSGQRTVVNIFAEDASNEEMDNPNMALGQATVISVYANQSSVEPQGGLWLDQNTAYRTRIHSLPIRPMPVYAHGNSQGVKAAQEALDRDQEGKNYVQFVQNPQEAEYILNANAQQQYIVHRPSDGENQPLIEQINGFGQAEADQAIDNLSHIARWERVIDMSNPGSSLSSSTIQIDLINPDTNQIIHPGSDGYVFRYRTQNPRFKVRVTNTGFQRLFCSLLYIGSQFQVMTTLLPQGGVWLDPGAEVWAVGGRSIAAEVNEAFVSFGRNTVQEIFKVLFSTKDLNTRIMELPKLGLPKNPWSTKGLNTRSLIFDGGTTGAFDDWNTSDLSVTVIKE